MFEKRVPPLSAPPSEKRVSLSSLPKRERTGDLGVVKGEKRVRDLPEQAAWAYLKCPRCRAGRRIDFSTKWIPTTIMCDQCRDIIPTVSWKVLMYGNIPIRVYEGGRLDGSRITF